MYSLKSPYSVSVKKDDEMYICQCGKTQNAPHCDGNHKRVENARPLIYKAEKDDVLFICGCGQSADKPWCDGSHNR